MTDGHHTLDPVSHGMKSQSVAYMLWFLLGFLVAHQFYVGRWINGTILAILFLGGFMSYGLTSVVAGIMLLVDLFTIPRNVRRYNMRLIEQP